MSEIPTVKAYIVNREIHLYFQLLRGHVRQGDALEAARRLKLVEEHLKEFPPKPSILRKKTTEQVSHGYLCGYQQACDDLLTPKDTPGQPATAITLLNRVGEMVLKTRAELLQIPLPRYQCPGCFCLMEEKDHDIGWCPTCHPRSAELTLQVADRLPQNPADTTMGVAGQPEDK